MLQALEEAEVAEIERGWRSELVGPPVQQVSVIPKPFQQPHMPVAVACFEPWRRWRSPADVDSCR